MTRKFTMRYKPEKPKRGEVHVFIAVHDGDSLAEVVTEAQKQGKDGSINTLRFTVEDGYDGKEFSFQGKRLETDEEFAKRLAEYEELLADYQGWHARNKENIAKYLKEKTEQEQLWNERKKAEDKKRLEKELKKLTKQLKELE